jgi:methyl-accepting chemotaxis protein
MLDGDWSSDVCSSDLAEAAKNTQALVEETVGRINAGAQLLERTKAGFDRVTTAAGEVAGLVGQIAQASTEQDQGLRELSLTMGQMDQAVQATAASAEETASAAEELSAQADQAKVLVGDLAAVVGGAGEKAPAPAPSPVEPEQAEVGPEEALRIGQNHKEDF